MLGIKAHQILETDFAFVSQGMEQDGRKLLLRRCAAVTHQYLGQGAAVSGSLSSNIKVSLYVFFPPDIV